MFIAMSLGGLISYYYSSHIKIDPQEVPENQNSRNIKSQLTEIFSQVIGEKPFTSFMAKRFIFFAGSAMVSPLIPLYLVRVVGATDGWISIITTSQTAILVLGYFLWTRFGKRRGIRPVLIWTTLGLSLYPFFLSLLRSTWQIALLAGFAGIFQAGLDLVFFDVLMQTVPPQYSALFVGVAQSMQFLATIVSPLIGTFIADSWGLPVGLTVAASIRFIGFLLFAIRKEKPVINANP